MAKLKNKLKGLIAMKYGDDAPSQEWLPVQIGMTQNTLSRWIRNEIGRFDDATVTKICEFFNCDVGDLLFIDRGEPERETA